MKTFLVVCAIVLSGCAAGPDFHTPAAPDTQRYTQDALPEHTATSNGPAGAAQRFATALRPIPMWWREFGSDALNRLVDEGLRHNPTLGEARARLREARENYTALSGTTQFPNIDAPFSGARQKVDPAAFGIPHVETPGPFSLFNASVSVSYVFDIFGGKIGRAHV